MPRAAAACAAAAGGGGEGSSILAEQVDGLFRPPKSLFVCAEDYVCVSDLIDAVRFGLHKATLTANSLPAVRPLAVDDLKNPEGPRAAWVDAFCASAAEEIEDSNAPNAMRDMVASICDDVILFASPLVGDWQRPEDPYLQPKAPPEGSKQPAAAEAAIDVGDDDRPRTAVGPAVLTRAGCVLAAAGCLWAACARRGKGSRGTVTRAGTRVSPSPTMRSPGSGWERLSALIDGFSLASIEPSRGEPLQPGLGKGNSPLGPLHHGPRGVGGPPRALPSGILACARVRTLHRKKPVQMLVLVATS